MNEFETKYNKCHKTPTSLKSWWKKNNIHILRVLLFYIYLPMLLIEKLKRMNYSRLVKLNSWNEERAKEFCDNYLPFYCEKTDNGFYFYNNGFGFLCGKIPIKRKDKFFVKKNQNQIFEYIKNNYEIDGYEKTVYEIDWWQIEIEFIKKEG